jgi:sulfotransferase
MLTKRIIYLTGLPRSGSTLLAQLLGHHPDIYSTGHSSPLCPTLVGLRHHLSDSEFLLSQLDVDFERSYNRLLNAYRGFMNGWFAETEHAQVVDKNRGWLQHLETVHQIDPGFRMLVCVRELGQIYGSIEAQHQKTILLDFPDHLAHLSRNDRAHKLFEANGVVGAPLRAIGALADIDSELQSHLFYVVFEHLMNEPATVMESIYKWLQVEPEQPDWQNLKVSAHESDSYYRYKYCHQTHPQINPPMPHKIPQRIQSQLQQEYDWFYCTFYPGIITPG